MTHQASFASAASAHAQEAPSTQPANDNAHDPIVDLTPIGDGIALARALARVLVRRELIGANAIPAAVHCKNERKAG
jgi:hypothetical protein